MSDSNRIDLSKFKISSIGTTVESDDDELTIEMKYSSFNWFMITFFGTTRYPYEIKFTCNKTGELFERLVTDELIEHFVKYRRR